MKKLLPMVIVAGALFCGSITSVEAAGVSISSSRPSISISSTPRISTPSPAPRISTSISTSPRSTSPISAGTTVKPSVSSPKLGSTSTVITQGKTPPQQGKQQKPNATKPAGAPKNQLTNQIISTALLTSILTDASDGTYENRVLYVNDDGSDCDVDDLLAGDQDCGKLLPQVEQLMATNSNLSPVQQNTEKDMSVVPDALNMLFTSMMWVLGLAGPLFIFGILRRML